VQGITLRSREPTALHAVVLLDVAGHRLDRLMSLEPSSLFVAQPLGLASVDQLDGRDVVIAHKTESSDQPLLPATPLCSSGGVAVSQGRLYHSSQFGGKIGLL